jgi:hypothetical protein
MNKWTLFAAAATVSCMMSVNAELVGFWIDNRTEDLFKMTWDARNIGLSICKSDTTSDLRENYEIPARAKVQYFFKASGEYAPLPDNEDSLLFENDHGQFRIIFWKSDGNCYLRLSHIDMVTDRKIGYNIRYVGDNDGILYEGGNVIDIISNDMYRITHCYKKWSGRTCIVVENITADDSWLQEVSIYDKLPDIASSPSPSGNKPWWSRLCCCCDD